MLMKFKSHPCAACKRLEDSSGCMAWGPLASCPVNRRMHIANNKQWPPDCHGWQHQTNFA
ncbi:hypothetical protein I7I53_07566 [Histoplasma capsulatum var. duboisii H88]|uniref:Uncharacterized protein n=1 Tax=Ajellomyces capsulatus (strain H88) TaxID=544711 RepID=A0A8A1LHX3_AJEC8|nr:hypothetical protein I7I53_07566 [Histoplasma capsulatum var. duboisii H88]